MLPKLTKAYQPVLLLASWIKKLHSEQEGDISLMSDLFSHVRGHVHHSLSLSKKHLQAPKHELLV